MHFVSAVVIPSLVIFMMTIVGLELTPRDFRRIADFPALVFLALAAQLVVVPLVAALVITVLHADAGLAGGLILVAASPIACGMGIRALAPRWTGRYLRTLMRVSLLALAALVVYVLVDQGAIVLAGLTQWLTAALLFTLGGLASGYAVGAMSRRAPPERLTVAIGFGARNLAVAIMIAATVLNRLDFVAFGAVFFLSQLVLVIPLLAWSRRRRAAVPAPLGVDTLRAGS